jgi:hypothetical protein
MQFSSQNNNSDITTDNETISTITNNNDNILIPSLTVKLDQTIFNNFKLNETPNISKINKLISGKLITDDEKTHLKKTLKKCNNNILEVEYKNKKQFGRVFCSNGSSSFSKKIRHTIYDDYVDIDIINSCYSILLSICKSNDIECKYIKKYVKHREDIFRELAQHFNIDGDKIKELFIILLNSGSYNKWASDNNINIDEHTFIKKNKKRNKGYF